MWYRLSQEGKVIWNKLSEAAKATILGNSKTPNMPSTHVNFYYVTLVDIIKASSHQSGFGDTTNAPSKYDITDKYYHTDADGNNSMILANLSMRGKISPTDISKVLSIPNPYSTQEIKDLNIDGKCIVSLTPNLSMCTPTTAHIVNNRLTGVIVGRLMARMLLSSIRLHIDVSKFEASIIMRLMELLLLPLVIWLVHRLDQLS